MGTLVNTSWREGEITMPIKGRMSKHHQGEFEKKHAGVTWQQHWGHSSSHTRLASPEVVDRGLAESMLEPSIGVGTFKKVFFCLTQVWPLAWVLLLCRATVYAAGPALSSTCLVTGSITDIPTTSHQTRDGRVGLMLSQCRRQWANIRLAFGWKINEYSISKSSSLPQ